MIIWLNLLAFGGLQAVFLWPLVLGLYWSRANGPGALASMVCGILCYGTLSQWGSSWPVCTPSSRAWPLAWRPLSWSACSLLPRISVSVDCLIKIKKRINKGRLAYSQMGAHG
jgi:Na+/proline symporter